MHNNTPFTNLYTYSDQPTTCPHCGARTEIILDLSHTTNQTTVQKCMNERCRSEIVVVTDTEIGEPLC